MPDSLSDQNLRLIQAFLHRYLLFLHRISVPTASRMRLQDFLKVRDIRRTLSILMIRSFITVVLCIRALDSTYSSILFWLLRQDSFFDYVMTGAKGSKMPRGDKSHIMNWSIELPDIEYWSIVESSLRSIDERMALHDQECIKLTQLRDTILPKLISGELKINDLDC